MKRLVFVAEAKADGESLYICSSFGCDAAAAIARQSVQGLPLTVSAFLIDTENGESAEEAARRCFGNGRHSFTFPEAIATYSA